MTNKIQTVVLAGGKGSRMNTDTPKALVPLKGKPMIKHLLDAIAESGLSLRPIIVVGQKRELVTSELGPNYHYAIQTKPLGTGHAVHSARQLAENQADHILVLYGDHPYVSAETIKNLADTHIQSDSVLTIATANVHDFDDWRACFFDFGRVIRDKFGRIVKIVEKKDATDLEKKVTEINPAYFCFKASWLWQHLSKIKNKNTQGEYYLTDMIGLAQKQGHIIRSISIEPREAMGINTTEQLLALEQNLLF